MSNVVLFTPPEDEEHLVLECQECGSLTFEVNASLIENEVVLICSHCDQFIQEHRVIEVE